jgi:dimethylhistidine N-methyltransferase
MSVNPAVLRLEEDDARDVLHGLTARPKSLPPRLFYDAEGSALFEQITEVPEYYLTSTEQSIFERYAVDMARLSREASTFIELGAGTARKTMLVLRAALAHQRSITFIPVDVSGYALEVARQRVSSELPQVTVHPLEMDYTREFSTLVRLQGRKLVLFIGSSIGNFEPMAASALLRRLRNSLAPGDGLLLGTDMRKPADVLLRAYDDASGVTARFNLNILARINREFDAEFDLASFAHCALWNHRDSRIEMHLRSLRRQSVRIKSLDCAIDFEEGETIHTENSYKFTPEMIRSLASNAGLGIEQSWSDEREWFSVTLMRVE